MRSRIHNNTMTRLAGKSALITGASRGIGRSVALAFAREGAQLYLVGNRDRNALDEVLTEVRSAGASAFGELFDVGDPNDVERIGQEVERVFGTLDIVVNNAGTIRPTPLLDITPEQWQETIRIHLHGAFYVLREMTNRFLKPQGSGKIINVSSIGAVRSSAHNADYAAAKSGVAALTRNAARELAPFNIQVNAVSPLARTRMTDALAEVRPAEAARLRGLREPDAVAATFVFLASSDSDYVSGQIIGADGGSHA